MIDGQRIGRKCFVGGDFNTILDVGWRGNRLREFVHETNLEVSNDPSKQNILEDWTFCSMLGHKRIIDYCLVPNEYFVESIQTINGLDLGSDHRAVQCCTLLPPKGQRGRRKRKKVQTDWAKFTAKTQDEFDANRVNTLHDLEDQLKKIAKKCEQVGVNSGMKGWDSPLLQNLRERRRNCNDNAQRSSLSN